MFVHYLISHFLTVITAVAAMLMAVHLMAIRRTPQSLLAWILGLAFLPIATIPLYFLLGTRKLPSRAKQSHKLASNPMEDSANPMARVLASLGAPPVRQGNRFELLGDGESAYRRLLDLIDGAERSIHLTIFILGDDPTGWAVVEALARRAERGVEVRLVVDAVGSTRIKRRAALALQAAGGSLKTFMPILHAPLRGRTNLRSHRKLGIFDGEHVFLGGMNIAEEYMGQDPSPARWRDIAAIVSGPVASDAEALFASDWVFAGGAPNALGAVTEGPARAHGAATVQLVPSGPDMASDTFYDAILTAMFGAALRIAIVTPYYVPDDVVQRALVLAARRGVRTELVVPARSNHAIADIARRSFLRELRGAGVHIRLYPHGMVHAKAMVVDDVFAFIGSPNMDMRSFFLNYEDALCIHSPEDIAPVRAWIDALLEQSTADFTREEREHRVLELVARLLAPEL